MKCNQLPFIFAGIVGLSFAGIADAAEGRRSNRTAHRAVAGAELERTDEANAEFRGDEFDSVLSSLSRRYEKRNGRYRHRVPIRGRNIRDTLSMIDQLERAVSFRDYLFASQLVWEIEDIFRDYRREHYLDEAYRGLQEIERILSDRYLDNWTVQRRVKVLADRFKRAVIRSDAYRRGRGGYYPPRGEPTRPWPPRHIGPRPPVASDRPHRPGRIEQPRGPRNPGIPHNPPGSRGPGRHH